MVDCPFWGCDTVDSVPVENVTPSVEIQQCARLEFKSEEGTQAHGRYNNTRELTKVEKWYGSFKTFKFSRQIRKCLHLGHTEIIADATETSKNMEESKFNKLCLTANILLYMLGKLADNETLEDKVEIEENQVLLSTISALEMKIKDLEARNADLERRWFKEMALKTERGKQFENVNDEFSNSNIARRFQNLNDDWGKVSRMMRKDFPKLQELERINILSKLMKYCYDECMKLADKRLRQFLLLDDVESIPVSGELQEIIIQRKRLYQNESVRASVNKHILEAVFSTGEATRLHDENQGDKEMTKLHDFYGKIIDCCWLIALSHPPMKLNFDVVGMHYEECKERWTKYATRKPVEDMNKIEGTIIGVVWPSLELKDETGVYNKGDVIVVTKGIKIKAVNGNEGEHEHDDDDDDD